MTSEGPDAAKEDEVGKAFASAYAAPAIEPKTTRRRRHFHRASFLRLSSGTFLALGVSLSIINVARMLSPMRRALLDFFFSLPDGLTWGSVFVDATVFLELACFALWSLGQQRVRFVLRILVATSLCVTAVMRLYGWHSLNSLLLNVAGGATFAVALGLAIGALERKGCRLVPQARAALRVSLDRLAIAILATMLLIETVGVLVSFAWEPARPTDELGGYEWGWVLLFFGFERATLVIVMLLAFLGTRHRLQRFSLLVTCVLATVLLEDIWNLHTHAWTTSVEEVLGGVGFDAANLVPIAMVLLVVRRVYGLRLVRVPRRVARSRG